MALSLSFSIPRLTHIQWISSNTDHSGSARKTCLSPISLIQMYSPDTLNNTHKSNPIYRSSPESVATELHQQHQHHEKHQHRHDHSDEKNDDIDHNVSNIQITPAAFMNMCPALLVQIEQGSCAEQYTPPSIDARKEVKDITPFGKHF